MLDLDLGRHLLLPGDQVDVTVHELPRQRLDARGAGVQNDIDLLASGGDEAAVAKLLGHASPAITRQIYRHVFEQPTRLADLADSLLSDPDNGGG
jgi:integrase